MSRKEDASPANISISSEEQLEIEGIYAQLRHAQAKLVSPDGRAELLPPNVNAFLYRLLADLTAGHSVTILQAKAALTTFEASKLLGMSRQFLVGLLEKNEIPFHKVGTHRRLYARDVLAYKVKRDAERRNTLDVLAQSESNEGLYERVPDDLDAGQ